jgi:DNA-binding NarL/FixJ family response regulator
VLTCRGYIKNILVKLDAHSQLEAVMIALRRKLIRLDDEI